MLNNQKGFTLIEMLIVLAVISLLLILFIPNLAEKSSSIQDKGCDALLELAENQLIAFKLDNQKSITSAQDLKTKNYLKSITCNNGTKKLEYISDEATPSFRIVDVAN
ncbi:MULTISPECIES: competence type IV pilus major pilin ComGC [Gracilibacillus]|uniref:ComG operon protein 3 n=1 Tax=Gracilibacillus dipsosauri TaxID=178340 RepID=A0A317L0F0_9BACI|nr:competence type IV pilus major pilin ComGC [Gracilibacillus dipsosauri]PWU68530.1 prepilin-type N-terminal cleavage/methylation domain-containing protein [Gracilibacillus dipsosauri]